MKVLPYVTNNHFSLRVIPRASKTRLVDNGVQLKLYLHAPPEDNKANLELIKFFQKEYGLTVVIKSGWKSSKKVMEIRP